VTADLPPSPEQPDSAPAQSRVPQSPVPQPPTPAAYPTPAYAPVPAPAAQLYAVKTPLGRAIGFSILSWGIWTIWWFYVNRRRLDAELAQGRDDATLHTLGLFVPVLNFFVVYWLWRDMDIMRRHWGMEPLPVVPFLVITILGLSIVTYPLVLQSYNEWWDRRCGGLATDARATTGEKVAVGVGAAFWALWVVLIVVAIVVAASS